MKKIYIAPESNVYIINVVSHLMEPSLSGNDTGSIEIIIDNPVSDDPNEFELASRKDNGGGGGSIWDNAW